MTSTSKLLPNPRRLLILSTPHDAQSIIPPFLHALTDSLPDPDASVSFAGYTAHAPLRLVNRYYTAEVPVWVDEIPCAWVQRQEQTQTQTQTPAQRQLREGNDNGNENDGGNGNGNAGAGAGAGAEVEIAVEGENKDKDGDNDDGDGDGEPHTPAQWAHEFSGPEARVVRDAVGAVVVCLRNPSADTAGDDDGEARCLKEVVGAVAKVRGLMEEERGGVGDVPGVLVLVGSAGEKQTGAAGKRGGGRDGGVDGDGYGDDGEGGDDEPFSVAWWEDQLFEMGALGFEVVEWDPKAKGVDSERRNRYGEYQGMRRVKEILETHEWNAAEEDADEDSGVLDEDDLEAELLGLDRESGFNLEVSELEREMLGLRMAIERGGDGMGVGGGDDGDDDGLEVDSLEALMMRMQAIRDMSAELPEGERKKFAAKAVRDIMKEL